MNVFNALCKGGPWDGRVKAAMGRRFAPDDTGFYFYRAANGPTPATWVWVPASGAKK